MLLFKIPTSTFTLLNLHLRLITRHFTSQNVAAAAQMPPRLVLNEGDIKENFLKGSGPGGQKIVSRFFYILISTNCHFLLIIFHRNRTNQRPPSN